MGDVVELQFQSPAGESLRFEWDEQRLAAIASDPEAAPVWELAGELDWDEVDRVRVLSARLNDGRVLAIVSLRPVEADGHGDELTVGVLGIDGSVGGIDETLLSTEYGPDDRPRRVGLELYTTPGAMPLRLAGDISAIAESSNGGVARVSAGFALAGESGGVGTLDLIQRA